MSCTRALPPPLASARDAPPSPYAQRTPVDDPEGHLDVLHRDGQQRLEQQVLVKGDAVVAVQVKLRDEPGGLRSNKGARWVAWDSRQVLVERHAVVAVQVKLRDEPGGLSAQRGDGGKRRAGGAASRYSYNDTIKLRGLPGGEGNRRGG